MKINAKLIYNLAFFSIIFMYFKVLPVNIETQPVFIVLLIPIFLFMNNKMVLSIKSEEKFLFMYLLVTSIYFLISVFNDQDGAFLYLLKLILGPISYIFILKNVELLDIKTLKIMTVTLFSVSIIYLLHIPLLYEGISIVIHQFLNRYTYSYIGTRGMSILTPEPSYFIYFAMLLLYSFDFVEHRLNLKENIVYKIMIYIMCILTKSALVYVFLCFYTLFKYLYLNNKIKIKNILKIVIIFIAIVLFVIVCSNVFNINLNNNRFFQIINSIQYQNFFDMLFYSDESSGFRFLINIIYILSIFVKPFGYGLGGMETQWSTVAKYFNIEYTKNGMFLYTYNDYTRLPAQAYIPNVIGAIGLFSILLVLFLYKNNRNTNLKLKKSILISLTMFLWILQSNMFNPIFWILIGFCKYYDEKKGENTSNLHIN